MNVVLEQLEMLAGAVRAIRDEAVKPDAVPLTAVESARAFDLLKYIHGDLFAIEEAVITKPPVGQVSLVEEEFARRDGVSTEPAGKATPALPGEVAA